MSMVVKANHDLVYLPAGLSPAILGEATDELAATHLIRACCRILFGVSKQQISNIINWRRWKNIPASDPGNSFKNRLG